MQVTIDGEPWAIDPDECANLAEIVSRAENAEDASTPSVVVAVDVDGQPVPADELGQLEGRSLAGVERVEIKRRSAAAVASSVLVQGADYTDEICKAIDQVAEHFQANRGELASDLLANVTDSMNVLVGITMSVAGVLADRAEALVQLQLDLMPFLEEMIEAQTREDLIRLADLLEYEIRPRIEGWGKLMRDLGSGGAEEASLST